MRRTVPRPRRRNQRRLFALPRQRPVTPTCRALARPDDVGGSTDAPGSQRATTVAATLLTVVLVAPAAGLAGRVPPLALALAVGVLHAVVVLAVWAVVRRHTELLRTYVHERFRFAARLVSGGWLVLCAQAAVPTYLLGRWALLAPMLALVPVTWALLVTFLTRSGDTDPLGLYVFYGPLVVLTLSMLGGGELVLRHAPVPL